MLYVSHFLQEVRAIADRVTVLRDGANALTDRAAGELDVPALVTAMLGRETPTDAFTGGGAGAASPAPPPGAGAGPLDTLVWENVTALAAPGSKRVPRPAALRAVAQHWVDELRIRCTVDDPAGRLSGGNQQKVVFAKWLATDPRLLLLDDPTRGVDVGAKREMDALIREPAEQGRGVLVCSTDLAELAELCDRVLLLHRGRCARIPLDKVSARWGSRAGDHRERLAAMADDELTRGAIQDAVGELGWRLVLREIRCEVRVQTLADAARAVSLAVAACGAAGQRHLSADVRRDRVVLAMVSADAHRVTPHDLDLARSVTDALSRRGLVTTPGGERGHPVQLLELAIDALDIPAVRPFWAAVTGFVDDPGDSPPNGLLDPLGQAPAIWFQQMDEPRPQRNRIHLDVSVPHDDAVARVAAVVAAGGKVVDDASAPAFWVLADAEGNEACVTTWQGRD